MKRNKLTHQICSLNFSDPYILIKMEIYIQLLKNAQTKPKGDSCNYSKRSYWWSLDIHLHSEKRKKSFFSLPSAFSNKSLPTICSASLLGFPSATVNLCSQFSQNFHLDLSRYRQIQVCDTFKIATKKKA